MDERRQLLLASRRCLLRLGLPSISALLSLVQEEKPCEVSRGCSLSFIELWHACFMAHWNKCGPSPEGRGGETWISAFLSGRVKVWAAVHPFIVFSASTADIKKAKFMVENIFCGCMLCSRCNSLVCSPSLSAIPGFLGAAKGSWAATEGLLKVVWSLTSSIAFLPLLLQLSQPRKCC